MPPTASPIEKKRVKEKLRAEAERRSKIPRGHFEHAVEAGESRSLYPIPADSIECWCGTFVEGSPVHNINLGGVDFHRMTEKVVDVKGSMRTRRVPRRGMIMHLKPGEIEKAKEASKKIMVRFFPARDNRPARSRLFQVNERYVRHEGDVPIGRYVYLVPVQEFAEKHGHNWRDLEPEPLLTDDDLNPTTSD